MNAFIDTMNNTTYTENGAITNKSTLDANLDWFFHGAAMRNASAERIIDLFSKAFQENPEKALKTLFYIRDCRGGQGERDIFRTCLIWLAKNQTKWLNTNLRLIGEYGRYDDYLCLLDTELGLGVATYLICRINDDLDCLEKGKPISLCAKWMPSLTSSKVAKQQAKKLIALANKSDFFKEKLNEANYRKALSTLRKAIKIVEHNLTNKDYDSIVYSQLPSYAALKYHRVFLNKDNNRYLKYIEDVKAGKTKINAKTLYPYDLVKKYNHQIQDKWDLMGEHYGNVYEATGEPDETVEAQWKALPDYVPEINGIVVNDTSGSMTGLPMDVSNSLAIYIAERNKSEVWRNYIIPFSSKAYWKEVKGNTLLEKLASVQTGDCSNTNLQAVFDLILGRAIEKNIAKEDMPKVLLIITDMEFDSVNRFEVGFGEKTNFEIIKQKYKEAGYETPNLVWWNVDSRNTQTPITKDDNGNILISGCSPAMLSVALSGDFNPIDAMNRIIEQPRYDQVTWKEQEI